MTALPTSPGFSLSKFAPLLYGLGQGLMGAGSRQGWSAFGPAMGAGLQDFQRMQSERQQSQREQERYDEWKRQTDEQRAERERLAREYQNLLGPGIMGSQQPAVTTSSGVPGGMMATGELPYMSAINNPPSIGAAAPSPVDTNDQRGPVSPAMAGGLMSGDFQLSPTQRRLLAVMPPEQGLKQYAEWATTTDQFERPIEIAGRLVDPRTGQVIADYSSEEAALRQASRPQTILNMPGDPTPDEIGRKAFAEANAKSQATYFDNVAAAGAQAQTRMGDIDQLTKLIELTPQGAGQSYLNQGAAILGRMGVDVGEYANVPAAQAFQSIVSRIAPTLRVAGSGATSDFEMQQFLSSLPAISNMPDGNRIIARNLKKISERSVQEAYIAAQVQGGDLTPAQGRKEILDLGPLNLDVPSFGGAPAGGPGGAPGSPVVSAPGAVAPSADDPLGILGQ
jgi:hypothetical protein